MNVCTPDVFLCVVFAAQVHNGDMIYIDVVLSIATETSANVQKTPLEAFPYGKFRLLLLQNSVFEIQKKIVSFE